MKIDFMQELKGVNGKAILTTQGGPPATLRDIVIDALGMPPANPREPLTPMEQVRRYSLMQRIYEADKPLEVRVEDVVLIKQLIPYAHPSPAVGGSALTILDPADEAKI